MNTFFKGRGRVLVSTLLVSLCASATAADSGAYPTRPVELVVPFAPGTAPDAVARGLAEGMSRELKQQVLVVNRPGAGGAIGYKIVQSHAPDGYMLVLNSNSVSTNYHAGTMPFTYTAFDPVAKICVEFPVLVVQASSPYNTLKDLEVHARQQPGSVRVGTTGVGSHMHLTSVAFFTQQKLDVIEVPFATGGHVTNLLGGHIDAVVTLPASVAAQVKSGSLKVLGVLGSTREPIFPDVQTAVEQGYDFKSDLWRGVAAPRGTPAAVLSRLQDAIRVTVAAAPFTEQGEKLGFLPSYKSGAAFAKDIATEDIVIADVMKRAGLAK